MHREVRGELTQQVDERDDHRGNLGDEANQEAHGHDFENDLPTDVSENALIRDRGAGAV